MAITISRVKFSKRMMIGKDNARIITAVTVTAVILAISIVMVRALLSQREYNAKIITAKSQSRDTLKANKEALNSLTQKYSDFDKQTMVNSTKVLNALPSKYDFPAVAASIEKIFAIQTGAQKYKLESFSGSDSQNTAKTTSSAPTPQAIPFSISLSGNYASVLQFLLDMERSIRPMNIKSLELAGANNVLTASVSVETYYQPAKKFEIGSKAVQ